VHQRATLQRHHGRLIISGSRRALLIGSIGPRGKRQRAGRPPCRLGQVLAAIALLLQTALPGLHTPLASGFTSAAGEFSAGLGPHALCLAQRADDSETPSDQAPKPLHHALAACCFWHGNAGLALAPAATLEPVAFARSAVVFAPWKQVPPRRLTGAIGARAPPVQA
jgi:hypothetical protein